jgi:hypothetical protein
VFDQLGAIVSLTTPTGAESNRYDYIDPYGANVDPFSDATTGIQNPWRFAGGYRGQTALRALHATPIWTAPGIHEYGRH